MESRVTIGMGFFMEGFNRNFRLRVLGIAFELAGFRR